MEQSEVTVTADDQVFTMYSICNKMFNSAASAVLVRISNACSRFL